jgi:quinol monooxygenase YgiN
MFARIVKMTIKPAHVTDWNTTFEKQILPTLRKEKGFQDEITLVGPTGTEIVAISLWDSKGSAEAYNVGAFAELVKNLSSMLDGTPNVKTYEVGNSTMHTISHPLPV